MLVVYKLHETQAVPAVKRHYITDNTAFATCNTLQYSKYTIYSWCVTTVCYREMYVRKCAKMLVEQETLSALFGWRLSRWTCSWDCPDCSYSLGPLCSEGRKERETEERKVKEKGRESEWK